jgi:flagellar motility protein MotE (MotC chaperone)
MEAIKKIGSIWGFLCLVCALSILLFFWAGSHFPTASAQEKKTEKKTGQKSGTKQDTKAGKSSSSATSVEEERLKILNADLVARIDQLKKLKAEMEDVSKGLDTKKKEQLTKVVKMYEAMPAEEAARAIGKLDDDTAVQILTSLKARSAGQILGQMDPDRVASLSKKALIRGRLPKEKSSP